MRRRSQSFIPKSGRKQSVKPIKPPPASTAPAPAAANGKQGWEPPVAQITRIRFVGVVVVVTLFGAGLLTLAARALGLVTWPWAVVLAPFSGIGVAVGTVAAITLIGAKLQRVDELESGPSDTGVGDTPPPDHLEAPTCAAEAGEEILLEHPEILAALCHGFRLRQLQPKLFGASIVDPWGIYQKALKATPQEFAQLKDLAHKHLEAFAARGKGRRPSDADAMKRSVAGFWKCAERGSRRTPTARSSTWS